MAPKPACLLSVQVSGSTPGASVLVSSRFFRGSCSLCGALDVSLSLLKAQSPSPPPPGPGPVEGFALYTLMGVTAESPRRQ